MFTKGKVENPKALVGLSPRRHLPQAEAADRNDSMKDLK